MLKLARRILAAIAVIVAAIVLAVAVAGLLYVAQSHEQTAAGTLRSFSLYVPMSDGTRIAIDVMLPKNLKAGERIPALIKGTPYWRFPELTFAGKVFAELGLLKGLAEIDAPPMNDRGYAVIIVDARGTGASFGHVDIMFDDREIEDFGEIIGWVARQSWSNGRVGAFGFSYRGILAANIASLGRPELKAIAPSFDFPDLYLTAHPGGVFSYRFIRSWSTITAALNRGEPACGFPCPMLFVGPKRVDADRDGALVAQAIAEHTKDWNVYDCLRAAPNRDDEVCVSRKSMGYISQVSRQAAIEKAAVPTYATVGYFDADSPAEVLERFRTISNPQDLTLAALSHGGFANTDPFAPEGAAADPTHEAQVSAMLDFFDRYLKDGGQPIIGKSLHYHVLNGGGWKTADGWPPAGTHATVWYLAADQTLSSTAPTGDGADTYAVDFTASTGTSSRYQSPMGIQRISYADRAAQDKKLLTYTSVPLDAEIEIVGDPVAKLTLASTATDGEVIVYLEDVAADGRVTYLTEGLLRLADRKISNDAAPTVSSDPLHTYLSADVAPMIPGKAELIEIRLSPIAVRLPKGDRIRIAIAGADEANLERLPPSGNSTMTVMRSAGAPSSVELQVQPEK